MSDETPTYRACLTCGRWMPLQGDAKQVYCSPECSRENLRCPVCGRYFEASTGVYPNDGPPVCSEDCARDDHQYDSLFKESP